MKKQYNNKIVPLVYCLLAMVVCQSQTVNIGEIYVSPGTILSTVSNFDNTATGEFINDGDVYVYANWNNDGMVDFLGTTGLTRYVGGMVQQITGSEVSYLYNGLFNNATAQPAFELSGDLSISGESSFDTGIVDNDNFGGDFIFEQNTDHNFTNDDSHVDGPVIKIGDNSFEFPIGDGGYHRWAAISAPDAGTDVFTDKYFFEATDPNYPVTNLGSNLILIDNAEHWRIDRSTTEESDVLITLSWHDVTTPNEILQEPFDAIHIARWDETQRLWVDEGGVVDTANQTVTTAVSEYGVFTLARVNEEMTLPCDLIVYNVITPDNDGFNDFFRIGRAVNDQSCAQNISVIIFNRWGVKVFEADNYDNETSVFEGYSQGRATISKKEKLPPGTYFYILSFDNQNNGSTRKYKKTGYLYINGE